MASATKYDIWYGPKDDRRHVEAANVKGAKAAVADLESNGLAKGVTVDKITTTTERVTL